MAKKVIAPPVERLAYSLNEVGQMLGMGEQPLRDLLNEGVLEAVKIGRRTAVTKAAVESFLARLPRYGKAA